MEPGTVADALETSSVSTRLFETGAGNHPLRVLAVIPYSPSNGSVVFIKRQVASLKDAGIVCEPFLLASRTSPWVLVKEWRRLRAMIRLFRPDIVHAHFGTVTALFTSLSTHMPLVVTYRGSDLNPNPSDPPLRQSVGRLFSQVAALRADRIICVSKQLQDRLWWRRGRVTVIPSGVDTSLFFPRPVNAARAELGWAMSERVVLFNASVDPVAKRFDLARSAVEVAKKICGEIRFVVLDGNVPPQTVPLIMNGADCLLLTSDWEGSPNIVKEAIVSNLPVVTVDVGDVKERLSGIEPTRIVARDPEAIGRALSDVLLAGKRSNGWQLAGDLSTLRIANNILSVYKGALKGADIRR
jgi:glycosyltransferase involved in cell wall biosynthesis